MLKGRNLTVSYEDKTLERRPAGGCFQEGILSLTLWCLVVDEVLKRLEEEGFRAYDYANDVAVVIRGNFLKTLRECMIKALRIIETWCEKKKSKINI